MLVSSGGRWKVTSLLLSAAVYVVRVTSSSSMAGMWGLLGSLG